MLNELESRASWLSTLIPSPHFSVANKSGSSLVCETTTGAVALAAAVAHPAGISLRKQLSLPVVDEIQIKQQKMQPDSATRTSQKLLKEKSELSIDFVGCHMIKSKNQHISYSIIIEISKGAEEVLPSSDNKHS